MGGCIADGVFLGVLFSFEWVWIHVLHVACFDDFFVCSFDACMYVAYVNGWIL
jgi:hypothetical protein